MAARTQFGSAAPAIMGRRYGSFARTPVVLNPAFPAQATASPVGAHQSTLSGLGARQSTLSAKGAKQSTLGKRTS